MSGNLQNLLGDRIHVYISEIKIIFCHAGKQSLPQKSHVNMSEAAGPAS